MENFSKYLNKIVRINGNEPAYVYKIFIRSADSVYLSSINIKGEGSTVRTDNIKEIKYTRGLSQELRTALRDAGNAIAAREKFYEEFRTKESKVKKAESDAIKKIKSVSDYLSLGDFVFELCKFLNNKFPSEDVVWECSSYGPKDSFELSAVKRCEKRAEYSFISKRYDDSYYINENTRSAQNYLKSHAPAVNSKVKEVFKCKTSRQLDIGDKRTLYASTNYPVKVKELTKKELKNIINSLSK